jgi:hypothetical protein
VQILELGVFLFEVPLGPAGCDIDLVDEGVALEVADLHLGHGDLHRAGRTLIVE